jgi:hypothetical protein
MDDELEQWIQEWLSSESPEEIAKLLRHFASLMDCRAEAERQMKGVESGR